MKAKGIGSIEELSKKLNVHRNTITPYLAGKRGLPDCLDRMLELLDLSPAEAILKNVQSSRQAGLEIAELVSKLVVSQAPNAYILFGSRARKTAKQYSDYDIGVFNKTDLSFSDFSKLIDIAEEAEQSLPFDINLTNLNLADQSFLQEIRKDWIFIGGSLDSWISLQEKANIKLYE